MTTIVRSWGPQSCHDRKTAFKSPFLIAGLLHYFPLLFCEVSEHWQKWNGCAFWSSAFVYHLFLVISPSMSVSIKGATSIKFKDKLVLGMDIVNYEAIWLYIHLAKTEGEDYFFVLLVSVGIGLWPDQQYSTWIFSCGQRVRTNQKFAG